MRLFLYRRLTELDQLCYPITLNHTCWFKRNVIRVAICLVHLIIVNSTLRFKLEVIRRSKKVRSFKNGELHPPIQPAVKPVRVGGNWP